MLEQGSRTLKTNRLTKIGTQQHCGGQGKTPRDRSSDQNVKRIKCLRIGQGDVIEVRVTDIKETTNISVTAVRLLYDHQPISLTVNFLSTRVHLKSVARPTNG